MQDRNAPANWQEKYNPEQHWFPSLPFQQFQVLFNSLFKVLCIFPSRYLFAIGLPYIFSFRWNLPPTLSCNPKQLDSIKINISWFTNLGNQTGVSPSLLPCSKGLRKPRLQCTQWFFVPQFDTLKKEICRFTKWAFPASVALTRGILVSFFSSA